MGWLEALAVALGAAAGAYLRHRLPFAFGVRESPFLYGVREAIRRYERSGDEHQFYKEVIALAEVFNAHGLPPK